MYLMEGRKLLDAQVFNGSQKLLKRSLQTFFFCEFFRALFLYTLLYTYLELKCIHFLTSLCRKNDWKKELEAMREERE